MDWITEIKDYVKNRFWGELEPQAGAYRYYHTLRVAGLGRQIAPTEALSTVGCRERPSVVPPTSAARLYVAGVADRGPKPASLR